MECRFKLLKLSTYNSLNNQLKLKDEIISQKEMSIGVLDKKNETNSIIYKDITQKNNTLTIERNQLLEDIVNNNVTIRRLHASLYEANEKIQELENKIMRVDQPRINGKFASRK